MSNSAAILTDELPETLSGSALAATHPASAGSLRQFGVLWAGQLVSNIGSGLTAFALGAYLFQRTNSATAVAIVTLCAFLPPVVLAPAAGILADRYDRRALMIAADGLSIIGLFYILMTMSAGTPANWQIYFGVGCSAFFSSLLDPAYRATITDLLNEDQYAKASGMVQLAGSAKYLISPVIAGLLFPLIGVRGILVIDISTIVLTVATTLTVKRSLAAIGESESSTTSAGDRISWGADFTAGVRELKSNKGVLTIVWVMAIATFCVGFLETMFPPMILSVTTPRALGIVETVAATGLLLGSLIISTINVTNKFRQEMLIGLACSGLFIFLIGVADNVVAVAASGFLFFASLPFVNTPAEVLIRKAIPNESQGRAWGLVSTLSNIGFVTAYALSGPLADRVFIPLLNVGGPLAGSLGRVFGTGPGRGIGLMISIGGLLLIASSIALTKTRATIADHQ